MDNSIYIALSRQLAEFRDMAATTNNLANANTTGYDSEHILFSSYLTRDINSGDRNPMTFAHDISSYTNTEMGSLQVTGNDLDMAIQGEGYFMVETPLGTRYTRAGNFQIASDGTMVTPQGYPVLNNGSQRIVVPQNATTIEVGELGNLKVNGEDFGLLGIAQFANPQVLERLGSNLYKSDVAPDLQAQNIRVLHGTLESSNVKPIMEMTHMLDVSRSVDSTAKFIEIVYDLERKTTNTWAQQS
jgi:flagellar basal-body rod protein FlgF